MVMGMISCHSVKKVAENQNNIAEKSTENPAWDSQYGGADKSYDAELLLREKIWLPSFRFLHLLMKKRV